MNIATDLLHHRNSAFAQLFEPLSNLAQANTAFFIALVDLACPALARHSRQVAALVRAFAIYLHMTETMREDLYRASLFHDIGLLNSKTDTGSTAIAAGCGLQSDENDRDHVVEGARLVKLLPDFSRGTTWIRHHHERYDGRGFPFGMPANSIPLGSRIIRIADVFDQRYFELGENREEAAGHLLSEAGGAFDPQLVEKFAAFIPREIH